MPLDAKDVGHRHRVVESKIVKLIELTQNRVAIVDDEDFKWLSQWNWYYQKGGKHGYAARNKSRRNKTRYTVYMHREILRHHGLLKTKKESDHCNDCGTDNRKENLRVATHNGNQHNRGKQQNNSSGVSGVDWHKRTGKWRARLTLNGKLKHLGLFDNLEEAKAVRQAAEEKYFGAFQHDPKNLCPLWKTGQCPDCAKRAESLGLIH